MFIKCLKNVEAWNDYEINGKPIALTLPYTPRLFAHNLIHRNTDWNFWNTSVKQMSSTETESAQVQLEKFCFQIFQDH